MPRHHAILEQVRITISGICDARYETAHGKDRNVPERDSRTGMRIAVGQSVAGESPREGFNF